MFKTICYISDIKNDVSQRMIQILLEKTVKKNIANDISGILIHTENNFLQIMEGETTKIDSLFVKIEKDKRHHHIIKLIDAPIKQRIFKEYGTSFTLIKNSSEMKLLTEYLEWIKLSGVQNAKNSSYILENYIEKISA